MCLIIGNLLAFCVPAEKLVSKETERDKESVKVRREREDFVIQHKAVCACVCVLRLCVFKLPCLSKTVEQ